MKFVMVLKRRWKQEEGATCYTFNCYYLFVIDVKEVNLRYYIS
jgi:hypothetical protein